MGQKLQKFMVFSLTGVASLTLVFPLGAVLQGTRHAQAQSTGADRSAQTRAELEAELKKIEAQIAEYEREVARTKTEKQTLANKITQLRREQEKITLQIKATNLEIGELGRQMTVTQTSIGETRQRLEKTQEQAAGILRAIHEQNQESLVEVLLDDGFGAFVEELETLEQLSQDLVATVGEVRAVKAILEMQHTDLTAKQEERENFLAVQTLQRQSLQTKTGEQARLLKETQGEEERYQAMLTDSRRRAEEIRSRIYELLGVSRQITFGEAVEIATWVSARTGVRPALLLAVLTQESNLGKNVGTCNRAGDPPEKSWRVVMKPERDHAPFLAVTQELGINPDITPVSCPMRDAKGNQIGWGGAMGPAQFIPSTWMGYRERIVAVSGRAPANPWDIRDAFIAAALYLKNAGAVAGNEQSEWAAAMRYFSGSTNPRFRFYGDNVLALARRYEEDIKALNDQ
ncbi:MAG: hypothetical protein Q8R13_02850 [bacterium]|nr:hypothetical protein [bacterium]